VSILELIIGVITVVIAIL